MLHPSPARAASLAKLAGLLFFALACAACASLPLRPDPSAQQACVEEALRRRPDHALAADAAPALQVRCKQGDLPSCSMLGVALELGVGVAADRARALVLYSRACEGGNMRACANQGALMMADAHPLAPAGALRLLHTACEAAQGRACAALGRAFVDGRLGSPRTGAPLLARACGKGEPGACVELADLVERGLAPGGSQRVTELLATACAAGDARGCALLDQARPGSPGSGDPGRTMVAGAAPR